MRFRLIVTLAILALPLLARADIETLHYKGDLEMLTMSGDECNDKERPGSRIPVDMVLKVERTEAGERFDGADFAAEKGFAVPGFKDEPGAAALDLPIGGIRRGEQCPGERDRRLAAFEKLWLAAGIDKLPDGTRQSVQWRKHRHSWRCHTLLQSEVDAK